MLTRSNEPTGFIKALANMAVWCSGFSYGELDGLIAAIRKTNALEESPVQYRLLRATGEANLSSSMSEQ